MKRIFFVALLLLCFSASAQQNIRLIYTTRTYHSYDGNYVEINHSIESNSLTATKKNGKFIKSAELTTVIAPADRPDSAIYVDKRIIKTPEAKDTSLLNGKSIIDLQRMAMDNGKYVVYFEIRDLGSKSEPMKYRDAIVVNYNNKDIDLSDIMLVNDFHLSSENSINIHSGYYMTPYLFDAISKNNNNLTYYVEIYNADKTFGENTPIALVTSIEDASTNKKVEGIQSTKVIKSKNITPFIGSIALDSLYEGTFYLNIEVRDSKNILYAYKRYPFYKESSKKIEINNAEIPLDAFVNFIPDSSLKENIRCLRPVANENEVEYIRRNLKKSTPAQDRYFLYQVYKSTNSADPQSAYKKYMQSVNIVNEMYSTPIKKGYETDMGRIYLVYGAPDNVIDEKFTASMGSKRTKIDQALDPYAPNLDASGVNYMPYQIWIYNSTPFGESNRKFVFYARQNNLSEYFLLHSNAKGELQDFYWEHTLSNNTLEEGVEGKAGKQFRTGHK